MNHSTRAASTMPAYWELVDALVAMACQYLEGPDGKLDEGCVSASEHAVDVLNRLGLVRDGALVADAFNHQWLREYYASSTCESPRDPRAK